MEKLPVCLALLTLLGGPVFAQVAQVRHAPALNGTVEGSIQQMTAENVTLNGGARVTGDLLVPGTPTVRLNGNPAYGGTLDGAGVATPASHRVTLSGNASLRHVIRRTDAVALPTINAPAAPTGTQNVTVNSSGQSVNWSTARHVTLNGGAGQYAVPPGSYGDFTANAGSSFTLGVAGATTPALYSFQHLTLNGTGTLAVVGPVIVTLAHGVSASSGLGNSAHPDWLALKFASGGLTLGGNASAYGYVTSPSGPVTISGNAQLVGGLIADQLTINGNGLLRLLAPPTTNQPPTVALTAPANGATFNAPASFTFTATAADADGTVAKVEFFQGGAKLGEDTATPFTFPLTLAAAGTYHFVARATDNAGSSTDSSPVTVTVTAPVSLALPFLAGFEPAEGYTLGPVNGQNGWIASSSSIVTDADFASGARSVLVPGNVPPLTLSRAFDPHPGSAVVFVDLFALPRAAATEAASAQLSILDTAALAFVQDGAVGRVSAFHGNGAGGGAWQRLAPPIAIDAQGYAAGWLRLTTRLDYTAKRWDLYINGALAAYDLGFLQNTPANLGSFTLAGQTAGPTLLDDFLAAYDNPVFADADKDGMADAWEIAHGLNPALNDRNADRDGDGLTNIQEYVLGTNPNNADTDGDGLPDAQERTLGTNPVNADTDGDGLPDGWELSHGLNPLSAADASADLDGDGRTNLQELQLGSDPRDFFNGEKPVLQALSGARQARTSGYFKLPTIVQVLHSDGTTPWPNAPVTFSVIEGDGLWAALPGGTTSGNLEVQANAVGQAMAYYWLP